MHNFHVYLDFYFSICRLIGVWLGNGEDIFESCNILCDIFNNQRNITGYWNIHKHYLISIHIAATFIMISF